MSAPCRKKLIKVALPLAKVNAAVAKEKSIRHGSATASRDNCELAARAAVDTR